MVGWLAVEGGVAAAVNYEPSIDVGQAHNSSAHGMLLLSLCFINISLGDISL